MKRRTFTKKQASILLFTVVLLALMVIIATTYIDRSTLAMRRARQNMYDVQLTMLCEAGDQNLARAIWRPFKVKQLFTDMDTQLTGASTSAPKLAQAGSIAGIGRFSSGVTAYFAPNGDTYSRVVRIRTVAWIDLNNSGTLDANDPQRTVDTTYSFALKRSGVFDYTYFVNNFGWMTGFSPTNLIVNGDMRSNGDFTFTNGSGTVNGSVIASYNGKLTPVAQGVINLSPNKWNVSTYNANRAANAFGSRWRPGYSSSLIGNPGDSKFTNYRDLVFQDVASMVDNRPFGSVMEDVNGTRGWTYNGTSLTTSVLDSTQSQELPMPDLSSFGSPTDAANANGGRFAKSKAWTDTKATFLDGTANPNFSGNSGSQQELINGVPNVNYTGAYLDVWDSTKNQYKRVSSNGVVSASTLLSGTAANPIRIHGPVTVSGDIGIAGYVTGQGTIYCSRNAHILGSVMYKNPPNFTGTDMAAIDMATERADILGIAASQSVIMGDTTSFGTNPLQYMTPPFTKPRIDDNGNTIPAFDANAIDAWGVKKYQSLLESGTTASAYKAMASGGINQLDAIVYTNFCGGGNVGTGGSGWTINGSIISKDEAMVTFSLPMYMNYDNRIRERNLQQKPLIDIDIPRSPYVIRTSWQDRGFTSR